MENEDIIGNIIEFIRRKCRERGWSIHKMLLQAKLSAHLVDDWKNGHAEPSLSALQAIGEVLGVPLNDFFDESPALTKAQEEIIAARRELSNEQRDALALYLKAMKSRKPTGEL